MKKLQNNFTTIEQSKRLLELGVPADSADCVYYVKNKCAPIEIIPPGNRETPHTFSTYANGYNEVFYPENPSLFEWDNASVLPCWSVGRLMEIITICHICEDGRFNYVKNATDSLVYVFENFTEFGEMDFSKLEE